MTEALPWVPRNLHELIRGPPTPKLPVTDPFRGTRLMNWRPKPPGPTPKDNFEWWAGEFFERLSVRKLSVLLVVTGKTGSGKSTLAIRFAERMSELVRAAFRAHPWEDLRNEAPGVQSCAIPSGTFDFRSQVVYTARALISQWTARRWYEPVIYDESVTGAFSRQHNSVEAKAVVEAAFRMRIKRVPVFLCIPNINALDKQLRLFSVDTWARCQENPKGKAVIRIRPDKENFKLDSKLHLYPDLERPIVTWKAFEDDDPRWRAYEAIKIEELDRWGAEKIRELDAERNRRLGIRDSGGEEEGDQETDDQIADMLLAGESNRPIMEELHVNPRRIKRVRKKLQAEGQL